MKFFIFVVTYCISSTLHSASLLDYLGWDKYKEQPNKVYLPTGVSEKKEQLGRLKTSLDAFKAASKDFAEKIQLELDSTTAQINDIKNKLKSSTENADLLQRLSTLNETYQTLFDKQFTRKQIISSDEQRIKLLEDYLKDPELKILSFEKHAIASFEDFKHAMKKNVDLEDKIKHLTDQKNEAQVELDNRKRKLAALSKEYQEKRKEQEEFSTRTTVPQESETKYKQQGIMLDLEEKLLGYQRQLAELKSEETVHRLAFLETAISIEHEKLKILKANLSKERAALRIDVSDLQAAKEKLEKKKQESLAVREKFYQSIKQLTTDREKYSKELEVIRKQHSISLSDAREIGEFSYEPKTIERFVGLCEFGYKSAQFSLIENKIEYLKAQIDVEAAKFHREEINFDIMQSWYKLTKRRFKTDEAVIAELKRYKEIAAQAAREEATFRDKRNTATNVLSLQNKKLTNLKSIQQQLIDQKDSLFKKYPTRYNTCASRFDELEKIIAEQIDTNNKIIEVYSHLIVTLEGMAKDISGIVAELESKSIWQRSEYAISWQGVKDIIPDLMNFGNDVYYLGMHYFSSQTFKTYGSTILNTIKNPLWLIIFIIKIAIIVLTYLIIYKELPNLIAFFDKIQKERQGLYVLSRALVTIIKFIQQYYTVLFVWTLIFALIYFDVIHELFLQVLLFLISIPLFSYLAYRLIRHLISYNAIYKYSLVSESFQRRFILVFSIFIYLTIILLLFREAFILTMYQKSELPTILLAMYSIGVRILIIFSIGKEELLSLMPSRGAFWHLITHIIDSYYYLILTVIIFIMIMSDPYVGGYGNLISYIIWGLVGTFLLVKGLFLAQQFGKKGVSYFFFHTDEEEVIHERFAYARTWFGLMVIALFFVLIVLGVVIGAKIWGKAISWQDIVTLLNVELFSTGFNEKTQQHIWFTPFKFIIVVSIIISGFLLAIAANRMVIKRIFDILPVDVGIQNTVMSISRYFIIFSAIFIAFQWGGLGWLLIAIGVVIGSIGYIVKEPISDFISYFIILVQRPIKIGDYIEIDKDIYGVVRHITPRSVILRKKDSYTIVLPNATLITHPVNNWNYSRNFVGLDDIYFTVFYGTDPQRIKSIVLEITQANTNILKRPQPVFRLERFTENGYEFMLRGFISETNTLMKWDIASDIRFALVTAFAKEGIKLAVPTRVIVSNNTN